MSKEIERKFLVVDDSYRTQATGKHSIAQGYLNTDPDRTVRVRIADDRAFITIKSRNHGCVRGEWEYEVPAEDARELLELCVGKVIEKTRYLVPFGGLTWEVDEFGGHHAGLVVAEVELPEEDTVFDLPSFVGREVTGDPAYYNSTLSV